MIIPAILSTIEGKLLVLLSLINSSMAISDVVLGELISSIPPTLAVLLSLFVLVRKQDKMEKAMDGKLTQLIIAEKGKSAGEAVAQERVEARERVQTDPPQKVEVVTDKAPVEVTVKTIPPNNTNKII